MHRFRKSINLIYAAITSLFLMGCSTNAKVLSKDDGIIEVAILQMNDVYEISGVDGGKSGDLSRVATVYKSLKQQYPQSMMVLAGDFLNPSLVGTMRYNGERIRGKQIVEVLNSMDLDIVAFGNHEFDIPEEDLQKRINESTFEWLATNIQQVCGSKEYPFYQEIGGKKRFLPETKIMKFQDADGTTMNLGIFSAVINSNLVDFVHYYNADSMVALSIDDLKPSSDVIIGLTHLSVKEDIAIAEKHQNVPLIMGGHEHDHMYHQIGNSIVAKADANAKTVYIHVLKHNKSTGKTTVNSELKVIDESVERDPETAAIVDKWKGILEDQVKEIVADPYEVVFRAATALDGRESSLRYGQTNMGQLFAESILKASTKGAEAAFFNSGSVRIDDQLSGEVIALDIFRALPFGGMIYDVEMKGSLLRGVLRYSENNKGLGAHLQYEGIKLENTVWKVNGLEVDDERYYKLAITDFLLRGLDIPFLTESNGGIKSISKPVSADDARYDIRKAIISNLKTK